MFSAQSILFENIFMGVFMGRGGWTHLTFIGLSQVAGIRKNKEWNNAKSIAVLKVNKSAATWDSFGHKSSKIGPWGP